MDVQTRFFVTSPVRTSSAPLFRRMIKKPQGVTASSAVTSLCLKFAHFLFVIQRLIVGPSEYPGQVFFPWFLILTLLWHTISLVRSFTNPTIYLFNKEKKGTLPHKQKGGDSLASHQLKFTNR